VLKPLEINLIQLIEKSAVVKFPSLKKSPPKIFLEIPKDKKHGNFSSNIALQLASVLNQNPLDIAEKIKEELLRQVSKAKIKKSVEDIQVKPPGFINIYLSEEFLHQLLEIIARKPSRFKPANLGKNKKIQIEFVSANPTGPLSIAHGRQAAVGDTLANILELCGYRVVREYFINDEGNQINALAKSVYARYLALHGQEVSLPEDGYQGDYIVELAREFDKRFGDRFVNPDKKKNFINIISTFSANKILDEIKEELISFGVEMDVWFSQRTLTKEKKVDEVIEELKKKNLIYEKDGALWFKSTKFDDDKDRVVIKKSGEYTYLAPDIAYHKNKHKRKFHKTIVIWGPDHHGYIKRLKAAVLALGCRDDFLKILIIQLTTLYRKGKPVAMSTRKGEYITLAELVNEIGRDAARFFFLMRKTDTHLDLDIELAKKKSLDNPVYYIQYAHARICSIEENLQKERRRPSGCDYSLLKTPEEKQIIASLIEFPQLIESAASSFEPYFLTMYLRKLAESFHSFYQKHRVLSEDEKTSWARLRLSLAVKNVLAEGLQILGISTPAKM
jgi:arginyl-tRNA synthetase